MKNINLTVIGILILALIFANTPVAAQTIEKTSNETALPTLRGDEAIDKLKENGQYDSLMEAVKQTRKQDEPQTEDAVGQTAKLIASDGTSGDVLGESIAISGDTAIVGATGEDFGANVEQGAAYVFVRSGTVWTQQQKLTAPDGAANDYFGISVAISGDTAIVGAFLDDVGANSDQGSAYVFIRSGTVWTQQQKLTASDGAATDEFGISVAIAGDTAIVGAYSDDFGANTSQGSAYAFVRSGSVWTQQQKLSASDGAFADLFGNSVAISGETAIVGAIGDDVGANSNQGSAYVFIRSGSVWTQQQKLTASDGAAGDNFGFSMAISGDTAIVGTGFDTVGANSNQGSAYIFVRSGTVWSQQQQLTAADGAASDFFGRSVAISGNIAIVGAPASDVGTNSSQGSAYVFVRSGSVWTQQQKLTASDGAADDEFGNSVAISGNTAVVGAVLDDVGANNAQGSAYAFRFLSGTWTQEAQKVASDGAAGDQFGFSVSISGDTAIVGAFADTVGANTAQGSAYIFVRSGTTWSQQAKITAADGTAADFFGTSVGIGGDTVIVGAPGDAPGGNLNQGSAYVFIRTGTSWSQQAKLIASDGAIGENFGASVGISGETIIVGADEDNIGANSGQGSAYIFVRSGTTWSQQAKLTASDGAAFDSFGTGVSISGNTAIAGAFGDDTNRGAAYVFTRSGVTWTQQQKLTATGGAANDQFGASVGISGETVIVGAYGDTVGANSFQGSAYIFTRSGVVWTQQAQLITSDGAANDFVGYSVAIDGDTAVISADRNNVGANADQGAAYVFTRNGTMWTQQQKLTATGGAAGDNFSWSVAVSGDKIIVGAPNSDASTSSPLTEGGSDNIVPQATNQGAVFIFVNNLAPTAAGVSIGGRVLTSSGAGVRNAVVYLTKPNGETINTRTGSFGYYAFEDLEAGETYFISVASKRFTFAPQVITANENVTELDFTALE